MNTALEPLDHSPDTFQISTDMSEGMDDMLDFCAQVKSVVSQEFRSLGFSDSAVGELADIFLSI